MVHWQHGDQEAERKVEAEHLGRSGSERAGARGLRELHTKQNWLGYQWGRCLAVPRFLCVWRARVARMDMRMCTRMDMRMCTRTECASRWNGRLQVLRSPVALSSTRARAMGAKAT